MKMTAFWDVVPCNVVKFTCVSDVLAASVIALMIEAASTSEKSADLPDYMAHPNLQDSKQSIILSSFLLSLIWM
jgi:hypothetical protein